MKKVILLFSVLTIAAGIAYAQYQLPNPGFEEWDNSNINAEPTQWNSFATSDGTWASLASTPHHYHRSGGRPGTNGSSYLTIYSSSTLGIVVNGNMTTGRLHAGSMSVSSSDNYNYTQRSNSSHCQPFSGTPDSMYAWVSFYASNASSQAQISAIIHGDNDFRSPNQENDPSLYCGIAQTRLTRTTESASTMQWQQLKVAFNYSGHSSANYLLLNMTTNYTPGSGNANDSLSIDDIEFIYSAWLTGISINGIPVDGFRMDGFDYSFALPDTASLTNVEIEATTQANDASASITTVRLTDSTALATIAVTAEDNATTKEYHLALNAPMPHEEDPVGISDCESLDKSIRAYPNPVADKLTITTTGAMTLYDFSGRELMHIAGPTVIDLSTLPSGIYLLRNETSSLRLLKL